MRVSTALACIMVVALGCYRDAAGPSSVGPVTVRLSVDNPHAFVERIEVYLSEIAASTEPIGAEGRVWSLIARSPSRVAVPASDTDPAVVIGEGLLPIGTYRAVRLSLESDSSRVWLPGGELATVRWPVQGTVTVEASADEPLAVLQRGIEILVTLDADGSFSTLLADPVHDILFVPVAKATDIRNTDPALAARVPLSRQLEAP